MVPLCCISLKKKKLKKIKTYANAIGVPKCSVDNSDDSVADAASQKKHAVDIVEDSDQLFGESQCK